MATDLLKEAPTATKGDVLIPFPARLVTLLEQTDQDLRQRYGLSPGVALLAHLCVASMGSGALLTEFEETVLDIQRGSLKPNEKGIVDENCL